MYSLTGKVALVTGAASGIGRALASALAARGCRLALADIDEPGLHLTAAQLPVPASLHRLDVADRVAVLALAERLQREHGAVDVVVNNAGISLSQTVARLDYAELCRSIDVNFWGVVHGTQAFLPSMLQRNEGRIVNISSIFGAIAVPTQAAYNAAKFAVRGFTEALQHELEATGVRAVCVLPGGIRTNVVRNARFHVDPTGNTDHARAITRFDALARTSPEQAAAQIVRAIERGRTRVLIGNDARLIDWVQRLAPVSYWRLLRKLL
jgi:NAD(P)-dependent dehydrogenase (short-subunit alcohol dehydrogenase family)